MTHTAVWIWARAHRGEATLRALWLTVVFAGGAAAGGFLAWGPLAGGPGLQIALALAGGLLGAGLWIYQQWAAIQGRTAVARPWRRGLLALPALALLTVAGLSAVQMYRAGAIAPLGGDRVAHFERLWQAIDEHYPYFAEKGVDWDAVRVRYLPEVKQARTDQEFAALIAAMLGELHDGHSSVKTPPAPYACCLAAVEEIEGRAVVVVAGQTAQALGLARGAVVLAINGRDPETIIATMDRRLRTGSTPRQQRYDAFRNLFAVPPGSALTVDFEAPDGTRQTVTTVWPPANGGGTTGGAAPVITGRRLSNGWGLIRIPIFWNPAGHDLVAEFDAALDAMMDVPGLALDLRGNGGGSTMLSDAMAGRLLARPLVYGHERFRVRLPTRAWLPQYAYRITPRPPIYSGPVIALIDSGDASTAENFLVALIDSGRATTVGRPTAGSSGNPIVFEVEPGIQVRFSTGAFQRNDGRLIEGAGIIPDRPVAWTIDDVRRNRDPDLAVVEALVLTLGK
jgi:carboxyl-terminal processing protease